MAPSGIGCRSSIVPSIPGIRRRRRRGFQEEVGVSRRRGNAKAAPIGGIPTSADGILWSISQGILFPIPERIVSAWPFQRCHYFVFFPNPNPIELARDWLPKAPIKRLETNTFGSSEERCGLEEPSCCFTGFSRSYCFLSRFYLLCFTQYIFVAVYLCFW